MTLVLGIGARRGVGLDELEQLVGDTLAAADLDLAEVARVATVEGKEPDLRVLCERHGWELVSYPAELLATVPVPAPSDRVLEATGTASVAEAAASRSGKLVVGKTSSTQATVAVARMP